MPKKKCKHISILSLYLLALPTVCSSGLSYSMDVPLHSKWLEYQFPCAAWCIHALVAKDPFWKLCMAAFKSGKVDEKNMMKCAGQQAHVYLSQAERGTFLCITCAN